MNSFWSGHNLLGDTIGFVAAAHLYSVKIGQTVKVWFPEGRKSILEYFDGVEWVPKETIPDAIDAGRDPKREEWPNMNGVKRFYKWMDPTLTNPKSFDIHIKGERIIGEKLIGLITHANTQGDIPNHIVDEMISEARKKHPEHNIVAIGGMDNKYIPKGVEDWRQSKGDLKWIIDTVRKLDLLITPQTGPCFIAAGYKIPMWIYRSKELFWDYTLNYETYKVERWWEREDSYICLQNEVDINILKETKSMYKKIECSKELLNLLNKNNVAKHGVIYSTRGSKADDNMVQAFCMQNGFLYFTDTKNYYCINYKKEHKKYEYIGCGTSCKVFKTGNNVVKVYHNYSEDYYDYLKKINQNLINFPERIQDLVIICGEKNIHIIEEQFIKNDKSLPKEKFINDLNNFVNLIKNDTKLSKIDLYLDNIRTDSGKIYLVDTHRRNKKEDNDFSLDRNSWEKYLGKSVVVDGVSYTETYSRHNVLVYGAGKLFLKEVVNKNYNDYHNIDEIVGKRNCENRIKEFDNNDIIGKNILDIGCSMGGMMFAASKIGAIKCLGLEYNENSVKFIKDYCEKNDINNVEVLLQDIDDFDWFRRMKKTDTVFLLSILNTSNFSEKDSLISIANRLGNVLYIEGHKGENHLAYLKKLYYHTDYTNFSHKYVTDGLGTRPLIRCGYGGEIIGKKMIV